MEDELGALGLVLSCITLWNTVYLDAALAQPRADGYPVLEADVARLSPYVRRHINVHGHTRSSFPELGGHAGRCATRTPTRSRKATMSAPAPLNDPPPASRPCSAGWRPRPARHRGRRFTGVGHHAAPGPDFW